MTELARLQKLLALEETTRQMRHLQREFFWRKDRRSLEEAKRVERIVDHLLRDLEDEEVPRRRRR